MIVIVGAGLAGLVCARELRRRGIEDFLLVEANAEPGGRMRSRVTPDGFILDRGFQVLLSSYSAVQRQLDLTALQPRYFERGAILHQGAKTWTVGDRWRQPENIAEVLAGDMFTWGDRRRLAGLVARLLVTSDRRLEAESASTRDVSTAHYLWAAGFSGKIIERFFRPFFGGVFLDEKLGTSAGLFRYYLKKFATGSVLVPAAGIGAIPQQLTAGLQARQIRLGCRVARIEASGVSVAAVTTPDGERVPLTALVLATDAPATARLLERAPPPAPARGVTTLYFATGTPPYTRKLLALPAGRGRLVRHFVVMSNIAPEYAPPGQHLLCATVLDRRQLDDEALARQADAEMRECYPDLARLHLLEVRDIPYAQHAQPPGFAAHLLPAPAPTRWQNAWLCGDQTGASSIQAAMASGERTAAFLARTVS